MKRDPGRPKTSDISDVEVLALCRDFHERGGPTPDEALRSRYPVKVIYSKLNKLLDRDLIDYGVSLRTAWLTGAGRALLEGATSEI